MDSQFFIDEFSEYRKKEAEKGADVIKKIIRDNVTHDSFMGAMEMLKSIINLPYDLAKNSVEKERVKMIKDEMMAALEAKMLRRFLEDE